MLPPRALALLALLAPAPALAQAFHVSGEAGALAPRGPEADTGPALGLAAGLELNPRGGVDFGALLSRHARPHAPEPAWAVTTQLAATLKVDVLPIVPTVSIGPALQYAFDTHGHDWTFAGFLGLGLEKRVFKRVRAGLQVQYLTASFTSDAFPASTAVLLQLGYASEL